MILLIDAGLLVMRWFGGAPGDRDWFRLGLVKYADQGLRDIDDAARAFIRDGIAGPLPATCVDTGRILSLTPEERRAGYEVDFRNSRLVAPWWGTAAGFPTLQEVCVCERTMLEHLAKLAAEEPQIDDGLFDLLRAGAAEDGSLTEKEATELCRARGENLPRKIIREAWKTFPPRKGRGRPRSR